MQRTGIRERRFAESGVETSDLALPASENAIRNAGINKKDIDIIIFATLSPERCFPGSGVFLQDKLGLNSTDPPKHIPALDIRNQCSGFIYALVTATTMVQTGSIKHALVVGAETHSAAINLSTNGRDISSIFGDGAGAVVVSATQENRGIREWHLGSDGSYADALTQKIWDISKRPYIKIDEKGNGYIPREELWANMNGKLVFKNAVERMSEELVTVFKNKKITLSDIDLFFFHQANLRINEIVAKNLDLPENKLFSNIERYANTTAATIPILLAEAEETGQLYEGMKIAMVASGSGFTWGVAIADW